MLGGIIEVNDLSLKLACFWEEGDGEGMKTRPYLR